MRRNISKISEGFTLTELLVTLALMTVVFGILVSMMGGGVRVWERLKCGVRQEHEVYFAFTQIRRGLHAFHPFEFIPFNGSVEKMEFSSLVPVSDNPESAIIYEPGRIRFYYDRQTKTLCESDQLYRGMSRVRGTGNCKPLVQNVQNVRFSYYVYNENAKSSIWQSYLSDKVPPVAVKMELDYVEPCSEKKSKKEFLVSIPVGPIG